MAVIINKEELVLKAYGTLPLVKDKIPDRRCEHYGNILQPGESHSFSKTTTLGTNCMSLMSH